MLQDEVGGVHKFVVRKVLATEIPSTDRSLHDLFATRLNVCITMLEIFDCHLRLADPFQQLSHHSFSEIRVGLLFINADPRLLSATSRIGHEMFLLGLCGLKNPVGVDGQTHDARLVEWTFDHV